MCGIVGYIGKQNAPDIILDGLRRLEYRGYDSAGIAVVSDGRIELRRNEGKLINLQKNMMENPVSGTIGVGHTRWATHGRPTEFNAHPHNDCTGRFSVVHNGIIENYMTLKEELIRRGHRFQSETDTEVLAHLIEDEHDGDLTAAVRRALARVEGAFAVGVISTEHPDELVCGRQASPLIVGLGEEENLIASDVPAILPYTRSVYYLDDGEVARITRDGVQVMDLNGRLLAKRVNYIEWNPVLAEKGGYDHFMLKEIHEQPQVVRNTIGGRTSEETGAIWLEELGLTDKDIREIHSVYVVACGTAYYSGVVGKYLIEKLARVPVEPDLASEFRYRDLIMDKNTLVVVISQSGETADTIGALQEARRLGGRVVGVVNVKGSTITREVDGTLYIHAGPEIGVASTKAYMAMLIAMVLLSLKFARARGLMGEEEAVDIIRRLKELPRKIEQVLADTAAIERIAEKYFERSHFLYLGRGINFPTAMEGALKLKEISYIHAEAYAAGEMKHGPIALIDRNMPVLAIATQGRLYEKIIGNIQEAIAREGNVIALATEGDTDILNFTKDVIYVPKTIELLSPIINVVPLQLLAYRIAVKRGSDVDQPRNLAKSVTVE